MSRGLAASLPGYVATETVASWLTHDPRKRVAYCDDPYFWEGWESLAATCPSEPDQAMLRHVTFLLVKPEAVVGRRVALILDFLRARGFLVVGAWPVRLSRHAARALWRYQINSAPIGHIRALEMGVTAGELFVLGLAHALAHGEASSAAELLRLSKGASSQPADGTLRDLLRCPAQMLSFVHAPDDMADVIRELAIVCDGPHHAEPSAPGPSAPSAGTGMLGQVIAALARAASAVGGTRGNQIAERVVGTRVAGAAGGAGRLDTRYATIARRARTAMTSRYAQVAAHDLDVDATLQRMRGYLLEPSSAGLAQAALSAIELGWTPPERALEVVASLERARALPLWDRIVTAAHLTDDFSTGRPMLIPPPE